ncbi:hypothetical protein T08_2616 [Trichinella sp. T8]|nr:hypothetical protein T08_2616 [Trichinella sp. T8]
MSDKPYEEYNILLRKRINDAEEIESHILFAYIY